MSKFQLECRFFSPIINAQNFDDALADLQDVRRQPIIFAEHVALEVFEICAFCSYEGCLMARSVQHIVCFWADYPV